MVVAEAVIETVGMGLTIMVMGLEMEPGPEQPLVLVIMQRTTSLWLRVEEVQILPVAPGIGVQPAPVLISHWKVGKGPAL
jgi:hypothetical protein